MKQFLTLVIAVIFILSGCATSNVVVSNKLIDIVSSSTQVIHPGIQGAKSTVDIHVKIVLRKDGIESIDSCWKFNKEGLVNYDALRVYKTIGNQVSQVKEFNKGDTLDLYMSHILDKQGVVHELIDENMSFTGGEFWFRINRKGKKYLNVIKALNKKEDIYAP